MRREIITLLVVLLCVQIASAYTTKLTIKTMPYHDVQVGVYDSSSDQLVDNFRAESNGYGDVNFSITTIASEIDFIFYIKKLGETIIGPEKTNEDYSAGKDLHFDFFTDGFEPLEAPKETATPVENLTIENETIEQTNLTQAEDTQTVTGKSVSGFSFLDNKAFKTTSMYIGIVIVALVVIFLIIFGIKSIRRKMQDRKYAAAMNSEVYNYKGSSEMQELENKMKSLQQEINSLRNKDKIEQAKRRLLEDEKALIRLRRGEDAE